MELFDYNDPRVNTELTRRTFNVIQKLINQTQIDLDRIKDTRPIHLELYEGLTIEDYLNICVGEYRCDNKSKYLNCEVRFGDCIAIPPRKVLEEILALGNLIKSRFRVIQRKAQESDESAYILNLIYFSALILYKFLMIHPYVDGNGHISRFIVCGILIPIGLFPQNWTIHPRPLKDYIKVMKESSENNLDRLVMMIANDFKKI